MSVNKLSVLHLNSRHIIRSILVGVGLIHILIALLMPNAGTEPLLGDRAGDRLEKLSMLHGAEGWDNFWRILFQNGAPGDYISFLPAYSLFGFEGIIIQNIIFLLIGTFFLFRLCLLFMPKSLAAFTTIVYNLLPAALFHPHVAVTEAICNPILIVATYYLVRIARDSDNDISAVVGFGLAVAVLCFTRYVYLLFPVVAVAIVFARSSTIRRSLINVLILVLLSYSLVVTWWTVTTINGDRFATGPALHGLQSNNHYRAKRMAARGGYGLPVHVEQRMRDSSANFGVMGTMEFVDFIRQHPVDFTATVISDALNLYGNSGVNTVFGRFFGLFDLNARGGGFTKWRDLRDKHGLTAMLRELWRTSPAGFVFNVVFFGFWFSFAIFAIYGLVLFLRKGHWRWAQKVAILSVPIYLSFFTFASGSVRWDHRSPFEFLICFMFAVAAVNVLVVRRAAQHLLIRHQPRS